MKPLFLRKIKLILATAAMLGVFFIFDLPSLIIKAIRAIKGEVGNNVSQNILSRRQKVIK